MEDGKIVKADLQGYRRAQAAKPPTPPTPPPPAKPATPWTPTEFETDDLERRRMTVR